MSDQIQERHISFKAFIGPMIAAILFGAAVIVIRLMMGKGIFLLWTLVAMLPVIVTLIYAQVSRISTAYRLFPDRLEVVSGILSRRIENVDLFRVRDVGMKQGLLGRMLNFGDLYLHSTDSSTPDLHIQGIDAPEDFYQQLRQQDRKSVV